MERAEFESRLAELIATHAKTTVNVHRTACEACERCSESFCKKSSGLVRCHDCVEAHDCADSSHLLRCRACRSASHCTDCERCTLRRCTSAFGCVGLTDKDFHILNESHDRQEYFEITARLAKALRIA
jgi:hypothetical protein